MPVNGRLREQIFLKDTSVVLVLRFFDVHH